VRDNLFYYLSDISCHRLEELLLFSCSFDYFNILLSTILNSYLEDQGCMCYNNTLLAWI
jgi:hypothetical protein